ncbi:MAG: DUF72 domain-containing protein [candidate division Zixibacteria bacterium]|nr:DUF72 domain-containing protein [candidate division Zixibacteria bacterium]
MNIKIGTSGYSFDDWKGPFYPPDIKKGKMFDHYVKHFPTVEINSTYYRIPHPAVMVNIEKKSPDDYEFIVKVPQQMTHQRKDLDAMLTPYTDCLKPMIDTGKLKGLLAQFPYSFKFSGEHLDYVRTCADKLRPNPLFVEFRHNSWVNRTMYDAFREAGIGYVAVDEPPLPGLLKADLFNTTDTAYLRLHGRNTEQWWKGGPLRYDYDYTREQLQEWKDKILKLEHKAKSMYIFFNNCHLGQAVKNALDMKQLMAL